MTHASRSGTLAGAAVAAALLCFAPVASAQTWCAPPAVGVPALGGPPQWWDPGTPAPQNWPRLDDPRWQNALSQSFGTGASEEVSFRALRDAGALYLSWYVRVAPQLEPFLDEVKVAFSPGGGATDEYIEVFPYTSAAASVNAAVPPATATQLRTGAGGTFQGAGAEPGWVSTLAGKTRVWVDVPGRAWAVNMVVPIAAHPAGVALQNQFKLWFEVQVSHPPAVAGGPAQLVFYRLGGLTEAQILGTSTSAAWPAWDRTLNNGAAGCNGDVTIQAYGNDTGTRYVDGVGNPHPDFIKVNGVNTFYADPTNRSGSPIAANSICAQFRIANWGTQPNWNDVPNPADSLWTLISPTCPGGSAATNKGAIPGGAKATSANDISFDWTPNAAQVCALVGRDGVPASQAPDGKAIPGVPSCPNAAPTRRLHQCLLTELAGGGHSFAPAAVYRNMNFVNASKVVHLADVGVSGLTVLPDRDVMLYLRTFNMPAFGSGLEPPDRLTDAGKLLEFYAQPPRGDGEVGRTHGGRLAAVAPSLVGEGGKVIVPPRPPLGVDMSLLDQLYPTYVIYAFHDTGETVTVRGKSHRILQSQAAFGYYVTHEGDLEGWNHDLQGATRIAPDYYRVTAKDGQSVTVTTSVEAREPRKYGVGLRGGLALPTGDLSKVQSAGLALTLDGEYRLKPYLSVLVAAGRDGFSGKSGADDLSVWRIQALVRGYLTRGRLLGLAQVGAGSYSFDPGDTVAGGSLGVGAQYLLTPAWAVEATADVHSAATKGKASTWLDLQLGARYRF